MSDISRMRNEYKRRDSTRDPEGPYSHFNTGHLMLIQQRQRQTIDLLKKHALASLKGKQILEVGCGGGDILLEYLGMGADPIKLYGIDLLNGRLARAHQILGKVTLLCANSQHLPYADGQFDLALQYTAFSSILDSDIRMDCAREMVRVLRKPDGLIVWYDFWLNPTNRQTVGIGPAELRRLFPSCQIDLKRITLAPPIARRLVNVSWLLCLLLEKLQVFNSHYLAAIHPS